MPIRVAPHHKTTYSYDQPVPLSPHEVHLCPAPHARTPVVSYSLRVTPEQHFINWQQDPYGDWVARLVFSEPTRQLSLMVDRLHRGRPDVRVDHVGQGKWYPGEPLPRWALGVYWRADGVPLWRDPAGGPPAIGSHAVALQPVAAAAAGDTFSVNANEAEVRRVARFWPHGHTPDRCRVPAEPPNPHYPVTLDLGWQPRRSLAPFVAREAQRRVHGYVIHRPAPRR